MRIDKSKVFTLFALTSLTVALLSVNMNGPVSPASAYIPPPLPKVADLELYPRMVVDLEDPRGTQWHELHPSKTNYYHLTSWTPGNVLSPEDLVYMQESPMEPWIGPFEVDDVTIDLTVRDEYTGIQYWMDYECGYWTFDPKKPICTKWNEIKNSDGLPLTPRCWHLINWEDTGDGKLSDCDLIVMKLTYPNQPYIGWFHVELVTVTLKLTLDFTPVYLEFMGTLEEFQAMDYIYRPVCTMWHEILPEQGRQWHLVHWWDRPFLSPSDQILLTLDPTEEQLYIFWSMGDVNEDGYINETDLDLIIAHYCTGDPQYDIDEDGHVTLSDFYICVFNIGLDIWTYFGVEQAWYHVDKLTVAMNLTSELGEEHIVKFEGSLLQFKKYHWKHPNGTQWHEVNQQYCRQWYLNYWWDTNTNGILDYCDWIEMVDKETGWTEWLHVETLSTDMWLTMAVCDVEVTSIVPETRYAYPRWTNDIDVTLHNNGTVTFNCTVTLSYHDGLAWIPIATQSVTYLDPCNTVTLKFAWSLAGVPYCNRTLKAEATCTCGDTDEGYSWVKVKMPGDVDADGDCDADDVFTYLSPNYGKKYTCK